MEQLHRDSIVILIYLAQRRDNYDRDYSSEEDGVPPPRIARAMDKRATSFFSFSSSSSSSSRRLERGRRERGTDNDEEENKPVNEV